MTGKPISNGDVSPGSAVDRVRFVLVEPRTAGNVGAAARALKNLGFSRLVLVRPACAPLDPRARMMAVEAGDLLEGAAIHGDLDAALDGARSVIGTSARTGKYRRPHYRLDRFSGELARIARAGDLAVMFGREDRGLTDEELDRCTQLVHLPASDRYPSFNLAQAVLLVAYELRRAEPEALPAQPLEPPAAHAEREAMYDHLRDAWLAIGFLQPETAVSMMRHFRRLLGRACLTPDEVQMLRGVARQTLWAAGRTGGHGECGDER